MSVRFDLNLDAPDASSRLIVALGLDETRMLYECHYTLQAAKRPDGYCVESRHVFRQRFPYLRDQAFRRCLGALQKRGLLMMESQGGCVIRYRVEYAAVAKILDSMQGDKWNWKAR